MIYALIAVSCATGTAGWVLFILSLEDRHLEEDRVKTADKDLRKYRQDVIGFVEFLQKHPHLLDVAIRPGTVRTWNPFYSTRGGSSSLNFYLQNKVEKAKERVAQHKEDLDLLDQNRVDF